MGLYRGLYGHVGSLKGYVELYTLQVDAYIGLRLRLEYPLYWYHRLLRLQDILNGSCPQRMRLRRMPDVSLQPLFDMPNAGSLKCWNPIPTHGLTPQVLIWILAARWGQSTNTIVCWWVCSHCTWKHHDWCLLIRSTNDCSFPHLSWNQSHLVSSQHFCVSPIFSWRSLLADYGYQVHPIFW